MSENQKFPSSSLFITRCHWEILIKSNSKVRRGKQHSPWQTNSVSRFVPFASIGFHRPHWVKSNCYACCCISARLPRLAIRASGIGFNWRFFAPVMPNIHRTRRRRRSSSRVTRQNPCKSSTKLFVCLSIHSNEIRRNIRVRIPIRTSDSFDIYGKLLATRTPGLRPELTVKLRCFSFQFCKLTSGLSWITFTSHFRPHSAASLARWDKEESQFMCLESKSRLWHCFVWLLLSSFPLVLACLSSLLHSLWCLATWLKRIRFKSSR